jgi:hypothetical protein
VNKEAEAAAEKIEIENDDDEEKAMQIHKTQSE